LPALASVTELPPSETWRGPRGHVIHAAGTEALRQQAALTSEGRWVQTQGGT